MYEAATISHGISNLYNIWQNANSRGFSVVIKTALGFAFINCGYSRIDVKDIFLNFFILSMVQDNLVKSQASPFQVI